MDALFNSPLIITASAILSTSFSIWFYLFVSSDSDLYLRFCGYDEKAFKGKIIWIAGASSGIGASLAVDFTKGGAQVILSARRLNLLKEVANECSKYGLPPVVVEIDMLDESSQQEAYDKVIKKYGHLDIIVLNAGRGQRSLAVDTSLRDTVAMMELNYFSFVSLTNMVLPDMISRKSGHVSDETYVLVLCCIVVGVLHSDCVQQTYVYALIPG